MLLDYRGKIYRLGKGEFLERFFEWDENFAEWMAEQGKVEELSSDHWKVLKFLREFYEEKRSVPVLADVINGTGFEEEYINELFKEGFRWACRIAGLPNGGDYKK